MKPRTIETIAELRETLSDLRSRARTIGFVPTMGALHPGHGALIETARRASDLVVVSIFVNPTQFDRRDDYANYGRDLEGDLAFCRAHAVDFVFAPAAEELYPAGQSTFVEVGEVPNHLCGEFRPGHFRGVATVVAKLFNIVQPHTAYFGEKDAQQLAVIRKMVADLDIPVSIVPVPTVREADGLALSSRNKRLTDEERRVAPALYQALQSAQRQIVGGSRDAYQAKETGLALLRAQPGISVEYFEIVDAADMQPVSRIAGPVCVAAAVWLGATRLIDNVAVRVG